MAIVLVFSLALLNMEVLGVLKNLKEKISCDRIFHQHRLSQALRHVVAISCVFYAAVFLFADPNPSNIFKVLAACNIFQALGATLIHRPFLLNYRLMLYVNVFFSLILLL